METIHADLTVSVTELKRNFASVLASANDAPVAVLNHNKPEAYLLSAKHYESILNALEDMEDKLLVEERRTGPFVEVALDEL
ncbi:MAG: type II toxin-antitoxin system Phd/YefM family antitoxin [Desulfovibrionaceae bacterium]|nr:type II toxin-antitoxin system Phd/YefM family antitoxin [Desulfovibrionaceae bacterium]